MNAVAERPPWVQTEEEKAAIAAAIARLTAERTPPRKPVMCEEHDGPGACVPGCAWMNEPDGYSEPHTYSDYLGGTSSIDVSGCHAPRPMPEHGYEVADGVLYEVTRHPEDCCCGKPECPAVIEEDAVTEVMGDRSGEVWTLTEDGWKRA